MSITLCHDGMTPRDDGGLRVAISIVKNDEFWHTIFRETTLGVYGNICNLPWLAINYDNSSLHYKISFFKFDPEKSTVSNG